MKIKSKYLRNLGDVMVLLNDSVDIFPTEEGWDINIISIDRVSMAHIKISKDLFTDYEQWDSFAISSGELKDVLKYVGDEVEVKMGSGVVDIVSERLTQHIHLLASDFKAFHVPAANTDANSLYDAELLRRFIKASEKSECSVIYQNEKGIHISARDLNGNAPKVEMDIPAEECVTMEGAGKAIYASLLLRSFMGVVPKGSLIDMKFSTNYPLFLEYGDSQFMVTWVLAPRIEDDME